MMEPPNHCQHCGGKITYHGPWKIPSQEMPPDQKPILIKYRNPGTDETEVVIGCYSAQSGGWGEGKHWIISYYWGNDGWIGEDEVMGWMPVPE